MQTFVIHPNIYVGSVHLTVSELDRSLRFYGDVLGFNTRQRQDSTAWLTADGMSSPLVLTEQPGARPKPPRTTGLYHFAILVPSRVDLARSLRHLVEVRYPLQGAADHLVSEALYLADPDGNGIEIYADRARSAWPRRGGQLQMATDPLDVDGLLAELEPDPRPWDGLAPQTRIGHVHLHVADLRQAEAFYCDVLGFDLVTRYGSSALFVSAGGYHHHLGLNTWAGVGAPPPPPDSVGLRYYTLYLPGKDELDRTVEHLKASGVELDKIADTVSLRDPSGNAIRLVTGDASALPETQVPAKVPVED
jgi:catechol 2,3-dioxygenase